MGGTKIQTVRSSVEYGKGPTRKLLATRWTMWNMKSLRQPQLMTPVASCPSFSPPGKVAGKRKQGMGHEWGSDRFKLDVGREQLRMILGRRRQFGSGEQPLVMPLKSQKQKAKPGEREVWTGGEKGMPSVPFSCSSTWDPFPVLSSFVLKVRIPSARHTGKHLTESLVLTVQYA